MSLNPHRSILSTENPELQEWDVSSLDQMIGDVKQAHFKLLCHLAWQWDHVSAMEATSHTKSNARQEKSRRSCPCQNP
jgi:hypothetical protein